MPSGPISCTGYRIAQRHDNMSKTFATSESPTHRGIAAATGVALSTVSLALRKDARVKAETAERICTVAEQMGYRSNPAVSMWMAHVRTGLRPRFKEVIAYIQTIPKDHSYRKCLPFEQYQQGAEERASSLGYQIRYFQWNAKGMTSKRIRAILKAQGIRGLIFEYNDFEETKQYTLEFDWTDITAISLGGRPSDVLMHNVSSDYYQGATIAYRKLLELGYTRIGLALHMFTDRSLNFEISGGFLCAESLDQKCAHIPIHNTEVAHGWDRKGFCEWYKRFKPDAIVSPDRQILQFLQEMGVRVPVDMGFAHLIKLPGSSISGIEHHSRKMGSIAVDLVSSLLHLNEMGQPKIMRRELLEPIWYPGTTVRKVAKASIVERCVKRAPFRVYSRERDWQGPGQDHDMVMGEELRTFKYSNSA